MNSAGELEHADGSLISGGIFAITTDSLSQKVNAVGLPVHRGQLSFSFSGGNAAGFVSGSVATTEPATLDPTTNLVFADNLAVIRDGDSTLMSCEGALTGGGTGTIAGNVVVVAGQDKVDAQ